MIESPCVFGTTRGTFNIILRSSPLDIIICPLPFMAVAAEAFRALPLTDDTSGVGDLAKLRLNAHPAPRSIATAWRGQ